MVRPNTRGRSSLCFAPEVHLSDFPSTVRANMSNGFQWASGLVLTLALTAGFSGCGGGETGPILHAVSGVVTHAGQPLSKLVIKFTPVSGGSYSSATTDDQGKFTLQFNMNTAGAIAGENIVYAEYVPRTPEEESAAENPNFAPPAPYKDVIKKYGTKETSPYRVTIDGPKDNLEVKLD
jgi:hypothetical protein